MTRPTRIEGADGDKVFVATVTPDGEDWHVQIWDGAKPVQNRYTSTINRPDNGALRVSAMLRQQFGITGTFKTT
jgi:hypothetical protein